MATATTNEHKLRAQVAKATAIVAEIERVMRKAAHGPDVLDNPDLLRSVFSRDDTEFWTQAADDAGVKVPSVETVDIAISMLLTAAETRRRHSVLAD